MLAVGPLVEVDVVMLPHRRRVVLIWRSGFIRLCRSPLARWFFCTRLLPQGRDVLAEVALDSFLLCDLAGKPNLVCPLVEALHSPVFELTLRVLSVDPVKMEG